MGAYRGAETAVNLIQTQIQNNIATALADVRALRTDDVVTTEIPREYFIYSDANVYRPPAIFTIFEAQQIINHKSDGNHINAIDTIIVACVVEDRLERLLTIKSWRYQAALMKCLHLVALTSLDSSVILFSKVDSCAFSGIVNLKGKTGQEQIFRKEMSLRLEVDHIENLE
jgi:hypothetical protein